MEDSFSGFILEEPCKTMWQLPLIFQGVPGGVQRGFELNLLQNPHGLQISGVQRPSSIYRQIVHQLVLLQMIYQPIFDEDIRQESSQRDVGSGFHVVSGLPYRVSEISEE